MGSECCADPRELTVVKAARSSIGHPCWVPEGIEIPYTFEAMGAQLGRLPCIRPRLANSGLLLYLRKMPELEMRYFFDVMNEHTTYKDEVGHSFSDFEIAEPTPLSSQASLRQRPRTMLAFRSA